ncbi:MAG: beta-galactosidase [Kiritimatiellae bacterium]|nr:beta-galactosidase [Kiritimatiellia bacterium]MDD5519662.1 beta-galactosidase [Kiritimatiellia bacterium]
MFDTRNSAGGRIWFSGLVALMITVVLGWGVEIDMSLDRAKTDLNPGLKQIGVIKPRSADEIQGSNWTLGCETLDRDFAIFDEYKKFIAPLGIKTIRLQGGWAKTEKEKGKYDFEWLDKIINDATGRGLNIILETDYGNTIYKGGGGFDLAGGFPTSEEALAAWDRWVDAMANHYKGKVRDWAMWNEPDINKKHKPEDIAIFNIRTAEIIKRVIPDARIAGLSLASSNPKLLDNCLKVLAEKGKVDLFHWFIYHGYEFNPDKSYQNVEELKATLAKYSTKAKMRQGENGCPSEIATRFALSNHPWTEYSQAKWDLRRMLGDLGHDVESAVFTICDFNHVGREINRKGLLRATAEKKVEKIKLAYYSVQNAVSVFDNTLERVKKPVVAVMYDKGTASFGYRNKVTGQSLVVMWDNSGTPGDAFITRPAQVTVKGLAFKEPVWVDLVSGRIYEIPADRIIKAEEFTIFKDIPLYDAPVLVAEKGLIIK